MPLINIGSTPIQFPDSAQSPDWSEAVIQFAQAVADSINSVAGPYDVPAQSFLFNAAANKQTIPNLQFSSSAVRAAYVKYSVYRSNDISSVYEAGQIIVVYNANNVVGKKWEIINEHVGNSSVDLIIEDDGQFKISNTSGISFTNNKISYSAQAFSQ